MSDSVARMHYARHFPREFNAPSLASPTEPLSMAYLVHYHLQACCSTTKAQQLTLNLCNDCPAEQKQLAHPLKPPCLVLLWAYVHREPSPMPMALSWLAFQCLLAFEASLYYPFETKVLHSLLQPLAARLCFAEAAAGHGRSPWSLRHVDLSPMRISCQMGNAEPPETCPSLRQHTS